MSTTPLFERVAVVGMGLMGGSVALAALARGVAAEVRGVDPHLARAGAIPLVPLEEAAVWADLIVLAVPVEQMETALTALDPYLTEGTLLTDLASVKVPMAELARRCVTHPEYCVGAHPMAGSHEAGFASARPDLFVGSPCFVTPSGSEPPEMVDRIEQFWQGLGTFTVRKTPEEHDRLSAVLSHAPHVIAFAFAQGLPGEEGLRLAGPGLRDFIRIARANPKLWCEILLMNRCRVAEEVARFEKNLGFILDALGREDRAALEEVLARAQTSLDRLESSSKR